MKIEIYEKKLRGVVLGTAFGDALGAPVERMTHEEILEYYGKPVETVKTKWFKADLSPVDRLNRMRGYGIVTDDTLMTLSLMNVYCIERRHLDAFDMAKEFVREIGYRTRYVPEFDREALILERLFYPEKHIFNRHALANCDPRDGGQGNMVNCGAAMYIAPVGVVNACRPKAAYDEAIDFAVGHQLSYGLEAAGVMAACVAAAFKEGATIHSVIAEGLALAKDGTREAIEAMVREAESLKERRNEKAFVVHRLHDVLLKYSPVGEQFVRSSARAGLPTANYTPSRLYSVEELPIALAYLLLWEDAPLQAVIDAVNSGRDTDSIGVMAAAIAGALHGDNIFDPEEIRTIDEKCRLNLDMCCDRFAQTAEEIMRKDADEAAEFVRQLKEMK